jgi:agmatinase
MPTDFDSSSAALYEGIYGLPFTAEVARVVLIPVPWEATVSYGTGTADGPAAILRASRQVDLLDRETGRPYQTGIAMLPLPEQVRAWSDEARRKALPVIESGGPGDEPALRRAAEEVNSLS